MYEAERVEQLEYRILRQSWSNLVQDEEVVNIFGDVLPVRKDQDATLNIEHRRRNIAVFHGDVFGREELRQSGFRLDGDSSRISLCRHLKHQLKYTPDPHDCQGISENKWILSS